MVTTQKKSFIVICVVLVYMFQSNSSSTNFCGEKYTGDLCEQILLNPDILHTIDIDKQISISLFGRGVFLRDVVNFIKAHFSPECIDRAGCKIFGNDDRIEYQYYGGYCLDPVTKYVKKAYLRFVFENKNSVWILVSIENLPVQKYPFHDNDWDGELKN